MSIIKYQTRFFCFLFILLSSLFTLTSCGEEGGESNKVDIYIIPDSPLVTKSDFVIIQADGEPKTINGPWFGLSFVITNSASAPLKVVSYTAEITSREDGITTKSEHSPDFADFEEGRSEITPTAVEPGETYTENVIYLFDSLAEQSNFRYEVKITFVGYFTLEDDESTENIDEEGLPGARFERTYRITTR